MVKINVLDKLKRIFGVIPIKGWTYVRLDRGFKAVRKKFIIKDGAICTTVINKDYISICCCEESDKARESLMHIVLEISIDVLEDFYSTDDAAEILMVYNFLHHK